MVKVFGDKLNPLVRAVHAFLKVNSLEFSEFDVSLNDILEDN